MQRLPAAVSSPPPPRLQGKRPFPLPSPRAACNQCCTLQTPSLPSPGVPGPGVRHTCGPGVCLPKSELGWEAFIVQGRKRKKRPRERKKKQKNLCAVPSHMVPYLVRCKALRLTGTFQTPWRRTPPQHMNLYTHTLATFTTQHTNNFLDKKA